MKKRPVSVVLPTYNRAYLLRRALTSVLQQIEDGDEIIVVDDGSTDETEDVVKSKPGPIRYFKTENRGAGAARNRGVAEAKGYYIAFVDSDDQWLPGKIALQRAFMNAREDVLSCFTDFRVQTRSKNTIAFAAKTWHRDKRSWDEILGPGEKISGAVKLPDEYDDFKVYVGDLYLAELKANYINVNTLLVRREEAGDAIRFAEDTETFEDWECHGRLAGSGKCAYLEVETVVQFGHEGVRLTDADPRTCAESRLKIIERVWGEDADFRKGHEDEYLRVRDEQLAIVAEDLIRSGESRRAGEFVGRMTNPPMGLRVLSHLPGGLVNQTISIGKRLKRTISGA